MSFAKIKNDGEMFMELFDVIIVGAGVGGLTSAIYTSREMLNTLVIEKQMSGGLTADTELIENYPGFPEGINGMDLTEKIKKQAVRFGTKITEYEMVQSVKSPASWRIEVQTDKAKYQTKALIVASGSVHKKLNVPGEEEFKGKGVSYCATCDGPLYRNQNVAVIGCGNSGLQEGGTLLKYVKSATFIEFLPYITAERILQERIKREKNARFLLNSMLVSINGENLVESITVRNRGTNQEEEIKVSGVFIYAGLVPNSDFLKGAINLDNSGYVITDENMATSEPGIFAVGDVRSKQIRQITTACGDGTIAAISAIHYLREIGN